MNGNTNFKAGDRVRLISMTDDPDPIPAGTTGTVVGVYPQRDWMQVRCRLGQRPVADALHSARPSSNASMTHTQTQTRRMNHVHSRCNRPATCPTITVVATYLHFDGYPDHVMPILEGGYLDPDEALELIEGGELRSISPRPAEPEYFENQPANREAAVRRRATTTGSLSERRAHLLLRRRRLDASKNLMPPLIACSPRGRRRGSVTRRSARAPRLCR